MKAQTKWLLLLVLLIVVLAGGGMVYQQLKDQYQVDNLQTATPSEEENLSDEEKMAIPNFELQDWEGNPVEFTSFLGKPVIINFWASWCPYCVDEMPYFETVYQEFGEEIQFLMIDSVDGSRETIQKGKDFLAKYEYTFPVYFDTQYVAGQIFGLQGLPATFLIDEDGYFVAWVNGMTDEETLRLGIVMLLK